MPTLNYINFVHLWPVRFGLYLKIKTLVDQLTRLGPTPREVYLICCTRVLGLGCNEVGAALRTRETRLVR